MLYIFSLIFDVFYFIDYSSEYLLYKYYYIITIQSSQVMKGSKNLVTTGAFLLM